MPSLQMSPPFLLLPLSLYTEHAIIGYGISLLSAGIRCPSCVSSQLLVHPHPPRWQGSTRSRKGLDTVQTLLNNNNNKKLLCYQQSFQHTTPYYTMKKANYPSQNQHISKLVWFFSKEPSIWTLVLMKPSESYMVKSSSWL